MGHELFNRAYKVTIGPPGGSGKVWSGLRCHFKIHMTADSQPNTAELTLYNMSKASRSFVEDGSRTMTMLIEAGYTSETSLPTIFTGRLELGTSGNGGQTSRHDQGVDWVTEVKATDGGHVARNVVLSKSFGPGISEESIIQDVAKAMGVTLGTISGLPEKQANHGRALSGPAVAELDRLCASHGLRWSMQHGVLHILPRGRAIDPTAFLISQDTGLVGPPEKTETGVRMVSLLQGSITPGRAVQLVSEDLKGVYVVEDVVHECDTHGQSWYTTIEAIPLSS